MPPKTFCRDLDCMEMKGLHFKEIKIVEDKEIKMLD